MAQTDELCRALDRTHQAGVDLLIDPGFLDRRLGQQHHEMCASAEALLHLTAEAVAVTDLPVVVPYLDPALYESLGQWLSQAFIFRRVRQIHQALPGDG